MFGVTYHTVKRVQTYRTCVRGTPTKVKEMQFLFRCVFAEHHCVDI